MSLFDVFVAIASLYYVKFAFKVKGWKPFTAQVLAGAVSTFVDFLIGRAKDIDEAYYVRFGLIGNLIVAITSLSLGSYSLNWALESSEATGVDVCNSILVLVNFFINLIQSCILFFGGKEVFEKWDDITKVIEALIGFVVILSK